ncbi:DUF4400 domain-containing protein [Vibrio parahaemolyticus]|uniref:DUF4400 domain-containing protein n=1 Tax=Vibrio parahaemolyticus TaxID=670 RepID=UPI00215CCE9D|nr:DUF4400 domain-containing protein [Vibrio parahaemolyticus]EGQ8533374.1 DUF4400 domain-containing protein [Vibrio parahaemolyticus]EJB8505131.1 DUF4400 domain-containing protein [Vibrio parahaemolyticus]EJL3960508.1 DUF4400 domain-containing protein [Vibrio parahaemolyticus]MCR9867995.1 DUF4400 domain-containing protein [Vibrio parahaemolyticus]
MADTSKPPQRPVTPKEPTPWYGLPFVALGHLFWIWVLLVIVEWASPLWGSVTGLHAKQVFLQGLASLNTEQPDIAGKLMQLLKSSMETLAPMLTAHFSGALAFFEPYWHGVVYVTLSLFARVALLLYSWPLFLLACFLGMLDGLIVRQRRTAFMGRETETRHFYSRKALPWAMIITGYVWLLVPGIWPVSPVWMLLPGVMLTGVLVRSTFASYKKYL